MQFTTHGIERRRPLWIALSDLYLDTDPEWERIAHACAMSDFPVHELQRILYDEVHPVVHRNLWSPAGEWQGFDEEWLVQSILSRQGRWRVRLPWPEARRYPWRRLRPLIVAERQRSGRKR